MEIWRNVKDSPQKWVQNQEHQLKTDTAVFHLHQQWELFEEKMPKTRYPLVHIESLIAQATRTLLHATDPNFTYIKMENALNFFNTELHDLSFCTIDNPDDLRKQFSYLWLEKHWLLTCMIDANKGTLQQYKVPPPLPYPFIPSEVLITHGLSEYYPDRTIRRRKQALEIAFDVLTSTPDTSGNTRSVCS